jgi:hypothetical protein
MLREMISDSCRLELIAGVSRSITNEKDLLAVAGLRINQKSSGVASFFKITVYYNFLIN